MTQTIVEELKQTRTVMMDLVQSIPTGKHDHVPFEGSWTAGQLLEHIDKSVNPSLLHGATRASDRAPDEKIAMVKNTFLDFNTKYESPEFIKPTATVHDKNTQLDSLSRKFDELVTAVTTLDLTEECLDFEVPDMGKFTRLEWITFYMVHTQRHLHQLKKIINAF